MTARTWARLAGMHRRPRLRHVALVALGFLLASAGVAYAYFSATASGTYALATAGRLMPPSSFTASVVSAAEVTLAWTPPTTAPPGSYSYVLTGTPGTGGTCAPSMPEGTTTCTVEGLTSGTSTSHSWTLAVKFHTWLSTSAQTSATTKGAVPSLCKVGGSTTWTGPATKPVDYPSCVRATDLLVLLVARSHNNTAACPAGWTLRATGTVTRGEYHAFLEVCSRVYVSGTSVTMTIQGTAVRGSSAEVVAFQGATTTTPFDTTPTTSKVFTSASAEGAPTFSAPSFTTTTANDLALSVVMENATTTTLPTLSLASGTTTGFTAEPSAGMQTTQSDALGVATLPVTKPGPVTFPTWTSTVASATDVWIGESLALMPDPPSGSSSPAVPLAAPAVAATSPPAGAQPAGAQPAAPPTLAAISPAIGTSTGGTSVTAASAADQLTYAVPSATGVSGATTGGAG